MNVEEIRNDFPILSKKFNGKKLTYLDNAATSLKPRQVLDAERKYYEEECANIHRGLHFLSEAASIAYENAHEKVAKFTGSKKAEVIFVRNATEGINLVMYSLLNSGKIKKGDKILVTQMEHHSNLVPWQYLEKKIGAKLEFIDINANYELDMDDFDDKVKGAKIVSVTGASNTIASLPDLRKIEKAAHKQGAIFVVDAAQLVPHHEVNFGSMNADFLVFSGHKMCAPTGTGAVIGKKKLLEEMEPFMLGGDMIQEVKLHTSSWNQLPFKFEAGTPHIAGAYGLGAAVDYLQRVGLKNIEKQEQELTKLCLAEMEGLKNIELFCPRNAKKQGGIVLFGSEKVSAHDIAMALSETENICIRSGMHCAEPLVSKFNKEGLARASFYFYNTEEETMLFIRSLKEVLKVFG